jgi:hypothetical protein
MNKKWKRRPAQFTVPPEQIRPSRNPMKSFLSLILAAIVMTSIGTASLRAEEPVYRALNPRGYQPETKLVPLAARPDGLNGKVVYVIHAWPANVPSGFENVVAGLEAGLKAKYPDIKLVDRYKDAAYSEDEPELWSEAKRAAAAFIYVPADSAATTMWSVTWSAKLEGMGLPGVVLHFAALGDNA